MFFFEKKNQKTFASRAAAVLLLALGAATPIDTAIQDPARPAADTARDANRKPAEVLAFAGIHPGERIADIMPGTGYFTRLFAKIAGPTGHVYAVIPTELAQVAPKLKDAAQTFAQNPAYPNVTTIVSPTAVLAVPEKVDFAWTSDNYHDVYGFFGADQAAAMDRAVFTMLKPGGTFIVIDHAANSGTDATSPTKLHRIDPATAKAQILAAGFKLDAESQVLHNPADPHTIIVFNPAIRGHTDQFVLRFRKPS